MNIGIIGSGRIGTAVGKRLARAGHTVMFGSRDAQKAAAIASDVGHGAQGGSYADAVHFADVLVLSTPWQATREVIESLPPLDGKILIETTNDFTGESDESTTRRVAQWAPAAHVVKAFNTIFYNLIEGEPTVIRPAVFLVGDSDAARQTVSQLVQDAGFDPIDFGSLADAHHVDALAKAIIHLSGRPGMGRDVSFQIVHVKQP